MIGKKLSQRYGLGRLSDEVAIAELRAVLGTHARPLLEVRAKDAAMIAVVVVRADEASTRALGIELDAGARACRARRGARRSRPRRRGARGHSAG